MRRKRVLTTREKRFNRTRILFGMITLVVIAGLVGALVWTADAPNRACEAGLQVHVLRFRVVNRYDQAIRVDWNYSVPGVWAEQYDVAANTGMFIYTTAKFDLSHLNLLVTVRAHNTTTSNYPWLPDKPHTFSLTDLSLVNDDGYYAWLRQAPEATALRFDCISAQVYEGPTLVFG